MHEQYPQFDIEPMLEFVDSHLGKGCKVQLDQEVVNMGQFMALVIAHHHAAYCNLVE